MKKILLFLLLLFVPFGYSLGYQVVSTKTYNNSDLLKNGMFRGYSYYDWYYSSYWYYFCQYSFDSRTCMRVGARNENTYDGLIPFSLSYLSGGSLEVHHLFVMTELMDDGAGVRNSLLYDFSPLGNHIYYLGGSRSATNFHPSSYGAYYTGYDFYIVGIDDAGNQRAFIYSMSGHTWSSRRVSIPKDLLYPLSDYTNYYIVGSRYLFVRKRNWLLYIDGKYSNSFSLRQQKLPSSSDFRWGSGYVYLSGYPYSYVYSMKSNSMMYVDGFLYWDGAKLKVFKPSSFAYSGLSFNNHYLYGNYYSGGSLYIDQVLPSGSEIKPFTLPSSSGSGGASGSSLSSDFIHLVYFVASGSLSVPGGQYYPYYNSGYLFYKTGIDEVKKVPFSPVSSSSNNLFSVYSCSYGYYGRFNIDCIYSDSFYRRNDYYNVSFEPYWYTLNGSGITFYNFDGSRHAFFGSAMYSKEGGSIGSASPSSSELSSGSLSPQPVVSSGCPVTGSFAGSFLNFGIGGWNILGFEVPRYKPFHNFGCLANLVTYSLKPPAYGFFLAFTGKNVISPKDWGKFNDYSGPSFGDVLLWLFMFMIAFSYLASGGSKD